MNIKKFNVNIEGSWEDLADNEMIKFEVGDGKHFTVEMNTERNLIAISGDNRRGRAQFKVIPVCANSIILKFDD